jgi:transcriptional regulator with XRE-family HTH domain
MARRSTTFVAAGEETPESAIAKLLAGWSKYTHRKALKTIRPSLNTKARRDGPELRRVGDTHSVRFVSEGAATVPIAARREEFREVLKKTRADRRLSLAALGRAAGVSKSAVAQWENGRSLPVPTKVPDLERALELQPGALSRLLGYLPITSGDDKTTLDVIESIRRDARLGEHGQELLITMYRQLLRQQEQDGSSG